MPIFYFTFVAFNFVSFSRVFNLQNPLFSFPVFSFPVPASNSQFLQLKLPFPHFPLVHSFFCLPIRIAIRIFFHDFVRISICINCSVVHLKFHLKFLLRIYNFLTPFLISQFSIFISHFHLPIAYFSFQIFRFYICDFFSVPIFDSTFPPSNLKLSIDFFAYSVSDFVFLI